MPVRGGRIARLFQLIALLKGPSCWDGRRLAEHFRTTRRNVQRDIQVLRMAGVPVYRDDGFGDAGGGYRIRQDYFLPKVNLTNQECLDLSLAARVSEARSLPLVNELPHVRDKLMQVLPQQQQELIRRVSGFVDAASPNVVDHGHCLDVMSSVQRALLTGKQVAASYYTPHGRRSKRLSLQPRALFLASHCWYLAAYDNDAADTKLYRVSRFRSVAVTTKPMTVTGPWSLMGFLGNAWSVMRGEPDTDVEIDFEADVAELVSERVWHRTQLIDPLGGGRVRFRATVSGLSEIAPWVLSWGPRAVVRRPTELANEVERLAREVAGRYGNAARGEPTGRTGGRR